MYDLRLEKGLMSRVLNLISRRFGLEKSSWYFGIAGFLFLKLFLE